MPNSIASTASNSASFLACSIHYVTKATPIHFIDGKCNIKQLKAGKSRKTCLTNYKQPKSHHIMPLVITALGGRHTHRHTHTYQCVNENDFKKPRKWPLAVCTWFKNDCKGVMEIFQAVSYSSANDQKLKV